MLNKTRILIAQDFSIASERATTFALKLARKQSTEVHMLTVDVVREDLLGRSKGPETSLEEISAQYIKEGRQLVESSDVDAEGLSIEHEIIRDVAAAPAITRYADENEIDLIVTGTHGRRGVRLALLGSVAAELVRTAPCPVLTVPARNGTRSETIRNILVPVDFSEASRGAVQYASQLADLFGADLFVAHVLETIDSAELYGFKPSIFGTAEGYKYVRKRLQNLCTDLPDKPHLRILAGRPADEITRFAGENHIDLIVMPTRGRAGLERFLVGSVAERVVSTAPCPVVSAKDFIPHLEPNAVAA